MSLINDFSAIFDLNVKKIEDPLPLSPLTLNLSFWVLIKLYK